MNRVRAWIQASRLLMQITFAAPLLYGQALAYGLHGAFEWRLLLLVQLFGFFDHLFIVYANEIADFVSDAQNTTFNRFSGGSRVVLEGKLAPFDLAVGSTLAFFAMSFVAADLVFREHRMWMVVMAAMASHLLWIYSFPPFRLSYRGGGEFIQGVGIGVLLPLIGFYAQTGTFKDFNPATLFPAFLLAYAGNLTTSLPDAPSDALTSKRSYAVRKGERATRTTSLAIIVVAAIATPLAAPDAGILAWLLVPAVTAVILVRNVPLLEQADAVNRPLCERFVGQNVLGISVVLVGWAAALVLSRFTG
jgi:1,4-dihydroxy-2-naphthoate octaprenyltransferase